MKLMKAALPLSTGALLMSVFHQLLGGNNGSGWGRSPPRIGWAAAGNAAANIVTMVRRDVRNFTVSITISDGPNNHYTRSGRSRGWRAGVYSAAFRKGSAHMPPVDLIAPTKRPILAISLGVSLSAFVAILAAVLFSGASAE